MARSTCDHEIRLAQQIECRRIGDAGHLGDLVLDRFRQPLELGQIAAEDLHRVLALHAGDGFLDVVLDVLREVEVDADELALELLAHLLDHFVLGQSLRPFLERLQRHEEFGDERAVRIGAVLAAALLGNDRPHRRITLDDVADAR